MKLGSACNYLASVNFTWDVTKFTLSKVCIYPPKILTLLVLDHCLLSAGVIKVDIPNNTSNVSGLLERLRRISTKALPSLPMSTE